MGIKTIIKRGGHWFVKNSATIAGIAAVGGFIFATIYVAKVAPEAKEALDKAKEENEDLTFWEEVKILAPYYGPAVAIELVSSGCIVFSELRHRNTQLGLAGALALHERALSDIKTGAIKEVGEKKAEKIFEKANLESANHIKYDEERVIQTGKGDQLWCDAGGERYFRCSAEAIHQAENEIKLQIWTDEYASVNDLYYAIGLPDTEFGSLLGWNLRDFRERYKLTDFKQFRDHVNLVDTKTAGTTSDERAFMIMSFYGYGGDTPTWYFDDMHME